MNFFEELDRQKNLLLTKIFEPEENSLYLEISVPRIDSAKELVINGINLGLAREIIDDHENIYKIYFPTYIGYSVINESFDDLEASKNYRGNKIKIYDDSVFLDYLNSETFATDDYPGKFFHYKIITLNHIINIASQEEPIIEKIT